MWSLPVGISIYLTTTLFMRLKELKLEQSNRYKLLIIDDDPGILDTLQVIVDKRKYAVKGFTDPFDAIESMHKENFDIMILDFLLEKTTGKEVVEEVRKFDQTIYIILLTGYNDKAPPIETLLRLDIQAYCEKNDKFGQLLLILESAVKSILLTRKLLKFHQGIGAILDTVPKLYELRPINELFIDIFNQALQLAGSGNGFILAFNKSKNLDGSSVTFIRGSGTYLLEDKTLLSSLAGGFASFIDAAFKQRSVIVHNSVVLLPIFNEFSDDTVLIGVECDATAETVNIIKVFLVNAQTSYNNAILHSIVGKKNNELNTMLQQLQENVRKQKVLEDELRQTQKMEVLGRLTGGIAHDFNNILLVISGFSEILLNRIAEDDPAYSQVKQIKKAGERASDLIKQLLAFSRKQNLINKPEYINDVIAAVQKMIEVIVGKNIQLELSLAKNLWIAMIDRSQMEQVIMNLIVNAKDAMPNGGTLAISTKNVPEEEILILGKAEMKRGEYVLMSVTDTGTGIKPEIIANIFDPFFTTKEQGKGTGLGLSTVYGIVKQLGGYIYVESHVGSGTAFFIYIPRAGKNMLVESSVAQKKSLNGTETILLVEDENDVRAFIKSILTESGYAVVDTADPNNAVTLFDMHPIDCVITDVIMPGMNGKQLIKTLQERNPSLKVLIISGYVNDEILEQGFYFSPANFIEKPFTAETLISKVREILDSKTEPNDVQVNPK
ncbi:MAG: response regulator [Chitinivibrionales bacterium]|nr:response regulator [Chitinivibrionales bacterium]